MILEWIFGVFFNSGISRSHFSLPHPREVGDYYLVPMGWMKKWAEWIQSDTVTEEDRLSSIDTTSLCCEHDMLSFDPSKVFSIFRLAVLTMELSLVCASSFTSSFPPRTPQTCRATTTFHTRPNMNGSS